MESKYLRNLGGEVMKNPVSPEQNFVSFAVSYHEAIMQGDYENANKFHKELMALRQAGTKEENALISSALIMHRNESVRLWAATFLLESDSELATQTLLKLTALQSPLSITARIILDLWKKKKLENS